MLDSTVKALVADLVPASRHATAYGVFAAVQGAAAIAGGVMAGRALSAITPDPDHSRDHYPDHHRPGLAARNATPGSTKRNPDSSARPLMTILCRTSAIKAMWWIMSKNVPT